jgi:hypothetical protein
MWIKQNVKRIKFSGEPGQEVEDVPSLGAGQVSQALVQPDPSRFCFASFRAPRMRNNG